MRFGMNGAARRSVVGLALLLAACGGGGGGGGTTVATPTASLVLLAGQLGGSGNVDGVGTSARFNLPFGVAEDASGNLYVADTANNIIRRITPAGVVTTFAGFAGVPGSTDGAGAAARFNGPSGVAVDSSGNVYVADQGNNTIRVITSAGVVSTLAGASGVAGASDGTGSAARFNYPSGVAVDAAHNVYVADRGNDTIRMITVGGTVSTLAGTAGVAGSTDGTGASASFYAPFALAVDGIGNVIVADTGNDTVRIINSVGVVSTLAGTAGVAGSADGVGAAARFNRPFGVTVDGSGNAYVTDTLNGTLRKVTSGGVVTTLAGSAGLTGSADGTGAAARFYHPAGVVADVSGHLYVSDVGNYNIRAITPSAVVTSVAGLAPTRGSADGVGSAASFTTPLGVAADSSGNVYVADTNNSTIRKISAAGVVVTLAGAARSTGAVDATGSAARFTYPTSVSVDGSGNVYVADYGNDTIRKVTAAGVTTTLAGTAGSSGAVDATGAAARFSSPFGVAVSGTGTVYVADTGNDTIRMITPAGVVSTLAGTAGSVGAVDGTGAAARFHYPNGVAVDGSGNVYVADTMNSTIRKITPSGVVITLAGTAGSVGSVDGTGAAARFAYPSGLAVDAGGNVFVADTGNSTVRKITPAGVVTTIIGAAGRQKVVPGSLPALLNAVGSVALMPNGQLVMCDANENSVLVTKGASF